MSLRRCLYRRKIVIRISICFVIFYIVRFFELSFSTLSTHNVFEMKMPFFGINRTRMINSTHSKTRDRLAGADAAIYTYDLPEKTVYRFVKGKRFQEYEIPVKNESVAYGPNLDEMEVLLIPFSHVDPGYGMTMESYYYSLTHKTLDIMVKKLDQYKDMTFQWAETVFLERWWRDIDDDVKKRVRALIQDGRLEIVSGGWVMPDEAITHYHPVVDQLIEGHQWLWENLGVKPKNNWANDPFGYSSTLPYLWKKSGIENMVILRIHQAIKGTLMKQEALEFEWKQLWSDKQSNSILCHIMAYRGYWIGDTCGPYNQHICREYAFMHTEPVHKVVFIDDKNIEERSRVLYEQYRITAEIYRRNNLNANGKPVAQKLYLPMFLGEDFSYTSERDFDLIHEHYTKLFNYMNAKSEWKLKFKFGTLNEYFTKIKAQQKIRSVEDGSRFPVVSGDFFPYSDYQNDYWTGYFTTRPFIKQFSRELQNVLKMADMFNVYAHAYARNKGEKYGFYKDVTSDLRIARRELGMFLHHDGITGTSVLNVVSDFRNRLFTGLNKAKSAMKLLTSQLLTQGKFPDLFQDTAKRDGSRSIRTDVTFDVSDNNMKGGSLIVVANPTPRWRNDVVSLPVISHGKYIYISSGRKTIEHQADAITRNVSSRISFVVELPPFSIQTYLIEASMTKKEQSLTREGDKFAPKSSLQASGDQVILENNIIMVEIDKKSGFPTKLKIVDGLEIKIETGVLAYKAKRSGAYIFAPEGAAEQILSGMPEITVTKDNILSEVKAVYAGFSFITTLYNIKGIKAKGLHIRTELDMSVNRDNNINKEVILRFKTDIDNGNSFFTDQNGFQLIGRKTRKDRLIEENYYPVTTMAVLEDYQKRLALHVGQPHGVASLDNGWIEVMLDRKLTQDDGKGLGQGIYDNTLTIANFVLQLEHRSTAYSNEKEPKFTYPTESNTLMSEMLNEPTYTLFIDSAKKLKDEGLRIEDLQFRPMEDPMPCDVVVVGLRNLANNTLEYNGTSLILHKIPSHRDYEQNPECVNTRSEVMLDSIFRGLKIDGAKETSLTHLHEVGTISAKQDLHPDDMELRTFLVHF